MWKFFLGDKEGNPVNFEPYKLADETKYAISTSTTPQIFGAFKTSSTSVAGTTTVASAPSGGSLVLTDLILSAEKKNGASVTLRITDGTNTETVVSANLTDSAVFFAHSFVGKWEGWQNARLEVVVVGNAVVSVAVGYYKIQTGKAYSEWNALR